MRDVLLTGKVFEAVERNSRNKGAIEYDAVVLDAPPTGRIVQFLNVSDELAGLAKVGPIKRQSDTMMTLFRSPRTAVHLVTVLEEMPVQETADGIAELRRVGLPVGGVVVNLVRPRDLADRRPGRAPAPARLDAQADRRRPRAARASAAARPGRRPARRGARPRRAPRPRGLPARAGRRAGRADLRAAAAGRAASTSAGSTSWPPRCASRGSHDGRRHAPGSGPLASPAAPRPTLDVDALLDDRGTGIIVCCGSGGVGKTTTSAALALRAAERGRKVVVLTIDPARRLAQSMGIEALDNTPRPVADVDTGEAGGSLDAMMLDMKRTFDEVVESQASPEKARADPGEPLLHRAVELVRGHPGVHGDGEARPDRRRRPDRDGTYDLIVVDTPPSRSALDFLDAPERLSSFLDGRFIRLMLAPARGPARLMTRRPRPDHQRADQDPGRPGAARPADVRRRPRHRLRRLPGPRAQQTYALLQADGTAFLVVAAPEPDALREAAYFVERLSEDEMPLAGLVVNRASPAPVGDLSADEAMRRGDPAARASEPGSVTARPAAPARRPGRGWSSGRPGCATVRGGAPGGAPPRWSPALAGDVHDLDGLRRVGELLAGGRPTRGLLDGATRAGRRRTGPGRSGPDGLQRLRRRPAVRAVSSTERQEAAGLRRSRARRSRSVMPPHTPHSIWLSSASARHSVRTGQPVHSCLALFCSAPRTKSWSGVAARQAAAASSPQPT